MNLQDLAMYLHVGSKTNPEIQSAINELIKKDESLKDQFGRFKTEKIPASPALKIRKPKAKSHYTRLTIATTNKAYKALYKKIGAVPLGD